MAPSRSYSLSELRALRVLKPEEWVRVIQRALRQSHGYIDEAAEALGVHRRTLQRWLQEDDRLENARKLVAPQHKHKPR